MFSSYKNKKKHNNNRQGRPKREKQRETEGKRKRERWKEIYIGKERGKERYRIRKRLKEGKREREKNRKKEKERVSKREREILREGELKIRPRKKVMTIHSPIVLFTMACRVVIGHLLILYLFPSFLSWGRFHQYFTKSFYECRSKKSKKIMTN